MARRWLIQELRHTSGALELSANRLDDQAWSAYAHLIGPNKMRACTSVNAPSRTLFERSVDAMEALEIFADQLGPVEPVLALLSWFDVPRVREIAEVAQ